MNPRLEQFYHQSTLYEKETTQLFIKQAMSDNTRNKV